MRPKPSSQWDALSDRAELSDEELAALSDDEYRAYFSEPTWFNEPFATWRALASQMRATIRIARRLHDGQLALTGDWDLLPFVDQLLVRLIVPNYRDALSAIGEYPTVEQLKLEYAVADRELLVELAHRGHDTRPQGQWEITWDRNPDLYGPIVSIIARREIEDSLERQRALLSLVLNYWLELGSARPRLDWSRDRPEVQLGGFGLFGALAVQLLFECSRTDGLAVCTSCGTPFLPGPRRPRRDRNAYCSDCGIKAAARDAAARYRQTKKYKETYRRWSQERKS